MVCWYFSGWADEQELLAHIAKIQTPHPKADPNEGPIYI